MFVALALIDAGYQPIGIRIDAQNSELISIKAREIINMYGDKFDKDVQKIKIMVSGNLNEAQLIKMAQNKSSNLNAIDIVAIEDEIVVCSKQPHLSMYFKIV